MLFVVSCAAPQPAHELVARTGSSCPASIETLPAEVFVVKGWKRAHAKIDGFEGDPPDTEKDAREVLCRRDACAHQPPYFVKAQLFPFRFPESAIAPLADGRLAVVPLGSTGTGQCIDGNGDTTVTVSGRTSGDLILLDEEVQPLAFVAEGRCEERGPATHVHRVVDPHALRQVVVKTAGAVAITVSARAVRVRGAGCDETRSLDP